MAESMDGIKNDYFIIIMYRWIIASDEKLSRLNIMTLFVIFGLGGSSACKKANSPDFIEARRELRMMAGLAPPSSQEFEETLIKEGDAVLLRRARKEMFDAYLNKSRREGVIIYETWNAAGDFVDPWGELFIVEIKNGTLEGRSKGANRLDDKGLEDDIVEVLQ